MPDLARLTDRELLRRIIRAERAEEEAAHIHAMWSHLMQRLHDEGDRRGGPQAVYRRIRAGAGQEGQKGG